MAIKAPERCLICGEKWKGGCATPNEDMQEGLRVFYYCGASLSFKLLDDGVYQILTKNCQALSE